MSRIYLCCPYCPSEIELREALNEMKRVGIPVSLLKELKDWYRSPVVERKHLDRWERGVKDWSKEETKHG